MVTGLVTGATGVFVIPAVPYLGSLGLERDDLVQALGLAFTVSTLALAAAYPNLLAVVAGTTAGMLLANVPVVFMGKAFADRLPLKAIHYIAAALFVVLGIVFLLRALWK